MNDTTERQEDMSIERYIADKLTDAYETGMKVAEDRLIGGHTRQEDTGHGAPRLVFEATPDPFSFRVNGSISVHDFANDPDFAGTERASWKWGYYLIGSEWAWGFDTRNEAAVAAITEVFGRAPRDGEDICDIPFNDRAAAEIDEVQRLRHIIRHAIPGLLALQNDLVNDCAISQADTLAELVDDLRAGLEPDREAELVERLK